MNERAKILEEAGKAVLTDRNESYGEPEDNFRRIAEQWSLYFKQKYDIEVKVTAEDVAWMLGDLKKVRAYAGYKRDNYVDMVGYAACGGEVAAKAPAKEEKEELADTPPEEWSDTVDSAVVSYTAQQKKKYNHK